jgi:hypothetical protein
MNVLSEALELLGLGGGSIYGQERVELSMARTRDEQRELADRMRRLPEMFADRISARTREKVTGAASTGRWEQAVDDLIFALHARAETVTDQERTELHVVLDALCMSAERVDALPRR